MPRETHFLPASTRKFEDFGFMQAHLCFKPSLTPERHRFGALVTIDDGVLQPAAKGFGIHPHKDVEVVTFMVEGEVNHIDPNDASHNGRLKAKGIQIITAGSGILHNEENNSETEIMRALQIWFAPRARNLPPSFARQHLEKADYDNRLVCILSPDGSDGSLVVQQNAYISYGNFRDPEKLSYEPKLQTNHSFIYVINGKLSVLGQELSKGDGFGVRDSQEFSLVVSASCEFLVLEVPPAMEGGIR